jgi:hypothetical protein
VPKLAALMDSAEEDVLAFMAFPKWACPAEADTPDRLKGVGGVDGGGRQ